MHRNHELIDRRILDASWGGKDFDVEVEAHTRAQVLISGGEGMSTEFKVQLPDANPAKVMKTIAAFANGGGGTILFGVADGGEVVGLDGEGTRGNIDRLANMIGAWIHPRIPFMVELVDVGGTGVIVLDIPAGADPPYGIGTSDDKLVYYVRRGSNSFPATPTDVRGVVRSRIPTTPAAPYLRARR
jgi:predicted HTH transcriptional regulator